MKIAGCLHVTKETAVLVETFRAAGAKVSWSGCNPLSTQDDVAAALDKEGTEVFAWRGLSSEDYYWCIEQTLKLKPQLTLDDGADLIFTVHTKHTEYLKGLRRRNGGDDNWNSQDKGDGKGRETKVSDHRSKRR